MKVQVYRENQIKNKTQKLYYCRNTLRRNEFILPSMTCCWCLPINNDSAFVLWLSGYITQELAKSIECPSSWWLTTALGLVLFHSDFQWFSRLSNVTVFDMWLTDYLVFSYDLESSQRWGERGVWLCIWAFRLSTVLAVLLNSVSAAGTCEATFGFLALMSLRRPELRAAAGVAARESSSFCVCFRLWLNYRWKA